MDKILLTAFLSALAGFITAILSIVKLVNEKESKTTDYRQSWTDSVRKAFADLVALINAQASQIANTRETQATLMNLLNPATIPDEAMRKRGLDFNENRLSEHDNAVRDTRRALHEAYALARLHFKPNDLSFNRIEQKFDVAMALLNELAKADADADRAALKEKVHATAAEITFYARDILKTEWETVKRGEPAYQLTKKWSIGGSLLMLFVLVSIGIHAGLALWKENISAAEQSAASVRPAQVGPIAAPPSAAPESSSASAPR